MAISGTAHLQQLVRDVEGGDTQSARAVTHAASVVEANAKQEWGNAEE